MVRFERSRSVVQQVDPFGDEYTLVAERLAVSLGGNRIWAGAAYNHPVAVIRHGHYRRVYDAVFLVRLLALLVLSVAAMIGTVRR